MSHPALTRHPVTRLAVSLGPRLGYLLAASVCIIGAALYYPSSKIGMVLLVAGVSLLSMAGLVKYILQRNVAAQRSLRDTVAGFVELDASPSFTTDSDGVIGFRNRAAKQRFKSTDGETLISAFGDLFASPAATLRRLQNKALAKGFAREDVAMRRGHMRLSVHQIGDDGFLWRLEDIGERAVASRNVEGVSLPMMMASKTGTILFMNDALRQLVGGRQTSLDRIVNDLPLKSGQVHQIAGAEGPISAQINVIDGAAGRSEIYLLPAPEHSVEPVRSEDVFDDIPVPILKVATSGEILMCNRQAGALLAEEQAVGQYLGDLVEGLGRSVSGWLSDSSENTADIKPEIVRATKQSNELFIQISLTQVIEGDQTSLVAVLQDATKLKTLEAQFIQSQKMQAIGQLAGGVAHDFNNLLTAISGHCDLLLLRHDNGDPDFADLDQISQNANRAASLVGQLLAFSRKQTLKPETIDMHDALGDLAHLLDRLVGEKVTLKVNTDANLPAIRADKRQLEQVIMNLVVNARDAMPEGGEVKITTSLSHITEPFERDRATVPAGDYIVVSVSDQGVGITPDKLPKIFEPFFTTKRTGEGTGLGLSMAYGIVKQTGGYIFTDSVPGSGTDFTLYFPAMSAPASELAPPVSEQPKAPEPPNPAHMTTGGVVLLVEDEAPVRAFASRALQMRGYTVIEAENAEEALKTLDDQTLEIDVFVTDVIMPGMDGPSWVAKALQERPDVKVVFVSGYAEDSFAEQQARIPNSVFLPKPFSLSELTATVHDQIH